MRENLGKPMFNTEGTVVECTMPASNDTPAYSIASKNQTDIIFTRDSGAFGEAAFAKGKYLVIPIFFEEPHAFNIIMRFYENYGTPQEVHTKVAYGVLPGFVHYITVNLGILDFSGEEQPRIPGRLTFMRTNAPTRPDKLDALVITIPKSATDYTVLMGAPYLSNELPVQPLYDGAYVDRLGQWALKDWKGKT